jgi:hypothetical protein
VAGAATPFSPASITDALFSHLNQMTHDINHNLVASIGALQAAQTAGGSTSYAHGVASNWVANAIHHSELVLAASHLAGAHGVAVPFTVQLHPSAFAPLPPVVHGGGGGGDPPPVANFSPTAAGNGYAAALAAPVATTAPFQYANYAPQERPPSAVPEPVVEPGAADPVAETVTAPATAAADNERPLKRRCTRSAFVEQSPTVNLDTTSSDKSGSSTETDTDNSGSGNASGSDTDYASGSGSDGKKKVRVRVLVGGGVSLE